MAVLAHRKETKGLQYSFPATNGKTPVSEAADENVMHIQNAAVDNKQHHFSGLSTGNLRALAFGTGNSGAPQATSPKDVKDPYKRRKPKQGIHKTSGSSLISAAAAHTSFTKRLHDRRSEGVFAIANIDRVIQWLDFASDDQKVCKLESQHIGLPFDGQYSRLST